jgi:hypothetical protein
VEPFKSLVFRAVSKEKLGLFAKEVPDANRTEPRYMSHLQAVLEFLASWTMVNFTLTKLGGVVCMTRKNQKLLPREVPEHRPLLASAASANKTAGSEVAAARKIDAISLLFCFGLIREIIVFSFLPYRQTGFLWIFTG